MNQLQENEFDKFTKFDDAMPLAPRRADSPAISADNPHWKSSTAFAIWILSLLIMIFGNLLFILTYGYWRTGGFEFLSDRAMLTDSSFIVVNLISIIPIHLITTLIAWALISRFGKQPFLQSLGWNFGSPENSFNKNLLIYIGIGFALFVIGNLIALPFGQPENELEKMLRSSRAALYITAVLATFTAPFVEEVVYRGILFPAFQRDFGTNWAIGLVTFLFALIHVPQYFPSVGVILVICVLSLALTVIRARTKNLLPSFIVHTVFNGIQGVLLVASPYFESVEKTKEAFFNF